MRWAPLLLLCACDRALHLGATAAADAADAPPQFFDARAQVTCPPIGTTPAYHHELHQVVAIVDDCVQYSTSAASGTAMALCLAGANPIVEVGPIDGALAQATGFDLNTVSVTLAPEGDVAASISIVPMARFNVLHAVALQPDGSWQSTSGTMTTSGSVFGMTYGPNRHVMVSESNAYLELVVDANGTWTQYQMFTASDLGVTSPNTLSNGALSADGLRLLVIVFGQGGASSVGYTDRATIDGRFRPIDVLAEVPAGEGVFLTEDCGRIYIDGLNTVFFVQEQ